MILGLGTDICPTIRWQQMLERHGARVVHKILAPEEAQEILAGPSQHIAERLAGRWALREAFGKALGTGMEGWSWKELRFSAPKLWCIGRLAQQVSARGIQRMHGSLSHDGGWALAVVILEGSVPNPGEVGYDGIHVPPELRPEAGHLS